MKPVTMRRAKTKSLEIAMAYVEGDQVEMLRKDILDFATWFCLGSTLEEVTKD